MSRQQSSSIPPELRERLQEETSEDRAELEAVWERLGRLHPHDDEVPDARETWEALQERLPADDASETEASPAATRERPAAPAPPSERTNGRSPRAADRPPAGTADATDRSSYRLAGPWAAAVLALLLVAAGVWWSRPVTVTAPMGERVTATLPDGSTVELNSGTSLAYPRGFQSWPFVDAAARTVRLDGEAFFDVQRGSRSFVVETFNARVHVLGTAFNVRARGSDDAGSGAPDATARTSATQVTVTSGRVRVSPSRRPDASVVLQSPGETSRVTDATARPSQPESTSVDRALVWRRNGFAASDLPFTAVVRELERRYDVTIRIDDSVTGASSSLSLYYPRPAEVETIIRDLCTARGLHYRPTSRGFEIYDE
jgi:ferric-dicitrate binding protein FerR (iron transport regulator)